jgi:hypothetical protein
VIHAEYTPPDVSRYQMSIQTLSGYFLKYPPNVDLRKSEQRKTYWNLMLARQVKLIKRAFQKMYAASKTNQTYKKSIPENVCI